MFSLVRELSKSIRTIEFDGRPYFLASSASIFLSSPSLITPFLNMVSATLKEER